MENEQEQNNFDDNNGMLNSNFFRPEYENQKVDNNLMFLKWNQSMKNMYGNNCVFLYCSEDNIYFHSTNEEYKQYPIYQVSCPICHQDICFYCHRNAPDDFKENGTCCLQRKIKCMFNQDCYRYIKPIYNEPDINTYKEAFISFIVPVFHIFTLMAQIQGIFFYKLWIKPERTLNHKYVRYYQHIGVYDSVLFINIGIAILLVIPLFFIHLYFIIAMIIISLPFKFVPLKCLLGIHFATINIIGSFCSEN